MALVPSATAETDTIGAGHLPARERDDNGERGAGRFMVYLPEPSFE